MHSLDQIEINKIDKNVIQIIKNDKPYEKRWKDIMASEIANGYNLRKLTEQLPDSMLEKMHRLLRIPGVKKILTSGSMPFDWHSGPLTKFVNLLSRQITQ